MHRILIPQRKGGYKQYYLNDKLEEEARRSFIRDEMLEQGYEEAEITIFTSGGKIVNSPQINNQSGYRGVCPTAYSENSLAFRAHYQGEHLGSFPANENENEAYLEACKLTDSTRGLTLKTDEEYLAAKQKIDWNTLLKTRLDRQPKGITTQIEEHRASIWFLISDNKNTDLRYYIFAWQEESDWVLSLEQWHENQLLALSQTRHAHLFSFFPHALSLKKILTPLIKGAQHATEHPIEIVDWEQVSERARVNHFMRDINKVSSEKLLEQVNFTKDNTGLTFNCADQTLCHPISSGNTSQIKQAVTALAYALMHDCEPVYTPEDIKKGLTIKIGVCKSLSDKATAKFREKNAKERALLREQKFKEKLANKRKKKKKAKTPPTPPKKESRATYKAIEILSEVKEQPIISHTIIHGRNVSHIKVCSLMGDFSIKAKLINGEQEITCEALAISHKTKRITMKTLLNTGLRLAKKAIIQKAKAQLKK